MRLLLVCLALLFGSLTFAVEPRGDFAAKAVSDLESSANELHRAIQGIAAQGYKVKGRYLVPAYQRPGSFEQQFVAEVVQNPYTLNAQYRPVPPVPTGAPSFQKNEEVGAYTQWLVIGWIEPRIVDFEVAAHAALKSFVEGKVTGDIGKIVASVEALDLAYRNAIATSLFYFTALNHSNLFTPGEPTLPAEAEADYLARLSELREIIWEAMGQMHAVRVNMPGLTGVPLTADLECTYTRELHDRFFSIPILNRDSMRNIPYLKFPYVAVQAGPNRSVIPVPRIPSDIQVIGHQEDRCPEHMEIGKPCHAHAQAQGQPTAAVTAEPFQIGAGQPPMNSGMAPGMTPAAPPQGAPGPYYGPGLPAGIPNGTPAGAMIPGASPTGTPMMMMPQQGQGPLMQPGQDMFKIGK